jgi:hypothetical protein
MQNPFPKNVQQMSELCSTNIKNMSNTCLKRVQIVFNQCSTRVHKVSRKRPTSIQQVSRPKNAQKVTKKCSKSDPTVSNKYPKVFNKKCPPSVPNVFQKCLANVPKASQVSKKCVCNSPTHICSMFVAFNNSGARCRFAIVLKSMGTSTQ